MAHFPHLYVPRPWPDEEIPLAGQQIHHLVRVLRLAKGESVSYTDGHGTRGCGSLGEGSIARQGESTTEPLPEVELAVAPPHERDRVRWLVEKAAELEVTRVRWLKTHYGNARPNAMERAQEWAVSALEQSRGAWLTRVEPGWGTLAELDDRLPTVMADPTGVPPREVPPLRVLIGPEGGWDRMEAASGWPLVNLGRNIFRTETAAVVAAALYRTISEMNQR
ncbi:MAG: RsmE family RNA methyltransferase [Acidimicrobiia bacterium]